MIFYLHNSWDPSQRFHNAFTPAWFFEDEPEGYIRVKVLGSYTFLNFRHGQGRLEPLDGCVIKVD